MRGNPHAAFDAAGAGNVARSRWCDTRRRKSEPTGNTNFGLNRRASPRPYRRAGCGNGATAEPLRHRQTKGAETDMLSLTSPRHTSTLPTPDGYGRRVCANTGHCPRARRMAQIDPLRTLQVCSVNGRIALDQMFA